MNNTQVFIDVHYINDDVDNIALHITNNGAWSTNNCLRIAWINKNPCIEKFNFDNYIQPDNEIQYYNNIDIYDNYLNIDNITEMLLNVVDVLTDDQLNTLIKHNIHLDKLIRNHPNT